jgi:ribulose bisphosphate carboxylase small subunit
MTEVKILGLQHTEQLVESLLSSGYKVKVRLDSVDVDKEKIWRVRNYIVSYEVDPDTEGYPSNLAELFQGYEGGYPYTDIIDWFDEMEVRKD